MTLPLIVTSETGDPASSMKEQLKFEIVQLEKLRQQIMTDMDAMREREANLRQHEARLREAQGATVTVEQLNAGWEKYRRAHALVEAERRAACDERLVVRAEAATLKQREAALRQRETWLELREKQLQAREAALRTPATPAKKRSLAGAPLAVARQVLALGRKKPAAA